MLIEYAELNKQYKTGTVDITVLNSAYDKLYETLIKLGFKASEIPNYLQRANEINSQSVKGLTADFEKLNKFYNDVDLFIIPSHQEGLCITGLEAMATGSVVLSTNCLGPKDFVINNKTGFYLEKKLNQFQDKINLLLNDHNLYEN